MNTIQEISVQWQVHLQSHQGKTINSENNTRKFKMSSNLPEALEVYRAAWLIFMRMEILFKEIVVHETALRLIGPGNWCFTKLLEILFRWSSTFWLHALYHVFGRIYLKTKKGPAYTYVFRNCIKITSLRTFNRTNELYFIW